MGTDVFKIKGGKLILVDYIKSEEEIDKETAEKIREKYSEKDEIKLIRRCLKRGSVTTEFEEYDAYVEGCRDAAKAVKLAKKAAKDALRKVKFQDGDNEREVYIIPEGN